MRASSTIRLVAALDLLITLPLAIPIVAEIYVGLLFNGLGLLPTTPDLLPLSVSAALFCNLAGVLGVLWNGARCMRPEESWLARLDIRGRLLVSALLVYYLTAHDAPATLWLFVATELIGAVLQWQSLNKLAR